ncbi:hypothetical protein [Bailinhaonella thermotolerans]|uniref:SWIM-type domain-containing protein n=1 Tax=Bailinhaonella thermotolerans TaxID=1070861 RepID=A0A3A4ATN8_9ACTN|nr:hypothetical protein [Bailinhaonella thermotolerans]RJL32763.1 hypothetical protein D5H75_14925 [Bailinhaonella thermotolerans]
MEDGLWARGSLVGVGPPVRARKLAKVPFVELADGRLQGVVSSGSDIARVYVSSISAGEHGLNCSTNNNRPCGGLHGSACKHLHALMDEAVAQYGAARVARYLRVEGGEAASSGAELMRMLDGSVERESAAVVFNRFLRHLRYLETPVTTAPLPEMQWFPGAVA